MNNKFFTFVLTLMLFGYANISGQTIIVNAIDDTNDGVCNAAHCSLREAIILANTYTNPEILIQIDPTVPQPWVIRPTTNLPKIQSTDTLFNLSLIGPYNRDVVIGGSLLPGKDTESDYGLVIDTKGKVDIKKLSFRDFSKALIVSNVDTLILGGVKSDLGGEDGNSFYFNKKDLYFDGLFEYCRITSNYFGSDRFLNQGVGYGETGISCRDGLKNRGKLIIGIGAIRHEKSNRFSGHTIAGIDLTGLSNVEINDNFFDTDFSAQSLLPPSKNNIRLKNCDSIFMSENYLGGTDTQMHLIECKNANIEWNNFGTINYYLVYPMKYGVVLDHCENINVGGTDPLKLNHYHGHTVSSIQVQNQSTNINILNNHIGTHTILNLPFVKNGITIEDSDHIHISENFFLGTVDNCVRVLNSEDLVILKNDFSVFNSFPPGGTGIYIENAQNINIGDPDMARNNIFSRLDKVVDIYGEESKQIYNYQNSFFCNSGKGLTLQTGANGNITPPFPYKRTGNIVYGKAHPLALVQIYNHGEECPQTPCQGKQHLDQIYADINGFWSFDFTGQLTGRKTFTATHPDLGTSEFSECYFIPDIILMSLTKIGNVCDDQIVKATLTSPPPGVMYSWSGPDGFVSASQEITTTNSGWYHVEVSHVTWNYTLSDSIFVQSIQPSVNSIGSSLCAGKSFSVEGHTFDESNPEGQFLSMYKSAAGCDSIINVKLTFKQPVELFITPELCKTETYTIGGSVFSINNPNGIAILQAGNAVECDTIVHVTLAFIENATRYLDSVACKGEIIEISGHILTESNPEKLIDLNIQSHAGCDSLLSVRIRFIKPVITTLSTFSACHGVNDGSITFSIDSSMNKPFNVFVNNVNLWQSTESYQEVKGLSAGNYIVRITDHRGCTSEVRSVEIEEAPINEITTPQNLEIPEGTAHQIELSTSVISNDVIWSPATYLSCTQCIEPVITPLSDQSYSYRIEDENGCITEGTIVVNVIQKVEAKLFVPNVFSPNGDGKNDHIVIHFANLTLQKMNIFDRWGGLVYSSVTDFSWDGKWNNRLVDPGVYVCMIKYQDDKNSDDKVYIGNIIVIR